ncbi:vitamin B6 photo-protection and homoeostasis-domain-containing protein [Epithele typhae]|uniref:vitamin B6 photo-protection and homoeostasis-domain-containing protein n=1 Tax=Epithele typhae TaxID=378194 RepID=UPI002008C90D|nr:vitamin B6 photo-protection and homoeostasis-domain-containing protein [Epithele typhae]KAH9945013.1 vitamin B6 photo-protection and homoeostasis-domain-containing protein [Epithele typhae]
MVPRFNARAHIPVKVLLNSSSRPLIGLRRPISSKPPYRHDSRLVQPDSPGCQVPQARPFAIERVGGRECHISWAEGGKAKVKREWRDVADPDATAGKVAVPTNSISGRVSSWFGQMFLPTNYPQSVHRSYLPFHILQAFETTLATITSVLCNQALLTSVGVSAEGSVFGAVAVQWIIKDGAGEIAKLFFIRHFSPYFDSHPKAFTLLGEALTCLGSGMMIASVLVKPSPVNFLLCAAGGNVFKLVGNAIWFTTHIKFIRYFSMQGNDGDVAAKDESQASIAQLAGYASGIGLLTFSHAPAYLYSIFFLAVPIHLVMTGLMMRVATFELLTLPRVSHLARSYVATGEVQSLDQLTQSAATGMFGEFYKGKADHWLTLAPRVQDVLSSGSDIDRMRWETASRVFQDDRYLLFPHDTPRGPAVAVFYHPDATNGDMLQSIFHAAVVRNSLEHERSWPDPAPHETRIQAPSPSEEISLLSDVLTESRAHASKGFPAFKQALNDQGWMTDELCFADLGYRVVWKH